MTGGGGGGGYSGGGGGTYFGVGGGGGSYNAGTNQSSSSAYNSGNGQIIMTWTAVSSCPSSSRTPVAVATYPNASIGSVTGASGTCMGTTTTFSANNVVLSNGTGAWSSSNTGVATVNASSGLVTAVAAGTCNIIYTITGGCGGTTSKQQSFTVYSLPALSSITGTLTVCLGSTTALGNSVSGGTWSSASTNIATIDATSGVATGVAAGTSVITYTVTSGNSCTSSVASSISVSALPLAPTPVTATPSALCGNATANLVGTSANNNIKWFTSESGGTSLGTSASGANFAVTPASTTTYYAEAATIASSSQTFNYSGSIVSFTVPSGVTSLVVEAKGAQGGSGNNGAGGLGAYIKGSISVTPGQVLKILAGQQGSGGVSGGGGGGSFVATSTNSPLVIAAGGGGGPDNTNLSWYANGNTGTSANPGVYGAGNTSGGSGGSGGYGGGCAPQYGSSEGAGGGGFYGDGSGCYNTGGGKAFINTGAGGNGYGSGGAGGFGGGGGGDWASWTGGGGGGGYSGGGGGTYYGVGGGGGSYNSGTSQTNTAGYQTGNGQVILTWVPTAACTSASRTPVTVTTYPNASIGSVTGASGICMGTTTTFSANDVLLSGGSGAWSSSNTGVATVNASSGVVTAVAAGTCNIIYTITGGCGGTTSKQQSFTVYSLPALSSISGILTVCVGSTTNLGNSVSGGTWNSTSVNIATIDATSGVATGVAAGTSVITYTVTSGNNCTSSVTSSISVSALPSAPTPVTATPSALCGNATANLVGTSANNNIKWYTSESGGTSLGTSASGANFAVTPASTTTYYAEAATIASSSQTFNYSGSIVSFTVPSGVTSLVVEAKGAQGGATYWSSGGYGAYMKGTIAVTPGQVLKILAGGQGGTGYCGGGGGGSFVTTNSNSPLVIAGGGGGGYYASYNFYSYLSNASASTTGTAGIAGANNVIGGQPG